MFGHSDRPFGQVACINQLHGIAAVAGSKDFAHEKSTKAPEGTTTGAAAGGAIGGTLGLLAGIGALAIPGVGPFIDRMQRERNAWVYRREFPTRGDKAVRAQSIRGRMSLDGLYVPQNASWLSDFRSELLSFPAGKHDDIVDALATSWGVTPRVPPPGKTVWFELGG